MKANIVNSLCSFTLVGAVAAACGPASPEAGDDLDVGHAEQQITSALMTARSNAIKSVHSTHPTINNPLLFAGIAYTETQMAHCQSEYNNQVSTYVCSGPYSADCGGAVTAGYWDGACSIEQGGLGMWQFDEGTYTQTINKWTTSGYWNGQTHDVLDVEDSISAAIDFILFKAWYSDRTPYFSSYQAMYDWINGIRPIDGNGDYETWLGFLAYNYNGQPWGSSGWSTTKEKYRSHTRAVYDAMGGDSYWYGAGGGGFDETVDDSDSACSLYGNASWWWSVSGYGVNNQMHYTWNNQSGVSNYVYWNLDIPESGTYTFQVFVPSNHATTTSAWYAVYDGSSWHWHSVNQNAYYNDWVTLGTHYVTAGTRYVYLQDATGETTGTTKVGVDAVRAIR